ncbi:MAG: SUMF1/EgtB/PvdO family nonheme iron enzyme [Chloroflexi bacterium]|uniref:SUMF1/EgtB/PvdO family nonheme iron enzyme n=1 Tax=Candidatus Chlorohelix allophototropha TaxID=3003348 RepID=A0A8T7M1T8_9CHLR|nr:SUMF1/EgtB/PvdO family nonheme iron enzyme [Chloroflexota bacterium]WJW66659.1 SUMF1/EgtB/PvdO family nonheme iron enzyme [Chloroflexota bacterium L227-S17]
MPEQIPQVKVFLSSPGDVNEERKLALDVLANLPNRPSLRDKVSFRAVAWDKLGAGTPMIASKSPQEAIDEGLPKPSKCDIVVVILWSRMGTPFSYKGVAYPSGTHYELLDALSNPQTYTLIYHRTEKKLFDFDDDKGIAQYKKVQDFFKSDMFYDPATGYIQRGVNSYASPAEFKEKFETDLESLVQKLLKRPLVPAIPDSTPETTPLFTSTIWDGSPFPGLVAFKKKDAPIFFGREHETDALVRKVAESRFVAVVGASGSGKSSLVGAGLLPRLETGAIPGSKDWRGVQFTPGKEPFEALFDAFLNTFESLRPHPLDYPDKKRTFIENVRREPAYLGEILKASLDTVKAPEWAETLLFIDQFEELFTLAKQDAIEPFTAMLGALAKHPRLRVVATLRHDFVHRAIEIPIMAELLRPGFFSLAAPTAAALSQMIERPAEMAGLAFEGGLPTLILHDTGSAAGSLALLAYLLDELYKVAVKRDHCLTYADYEGLGGVAGAIGKRAEQVFAQLPGEEEAKKRLLGRVFRELVAVNEVEGQFAATRQRVEHACFGTAELELVEAFTQARLLVMDETQVEVAHEALFRNWKRLRQWLEEVQEDLILKRQVKSAAAEWLKRGKPDSWRWQQERLLLVYEMKQRLEWKPEVLEEEFIEPEQARLLREITLLQTTHARRREIGDRLNIIGDTRRGIGTPEIAWLPVAPGGEVEIEKATFKVAPFYIGQYQITYGQYEAFVKAGDGYQNREWWAGFPKDYQPQKLAEQRTKTWNNPRDTISWYQAVAYGRWLNKRMRGLQLGNPGNAQGTPLVVGENAQIRLPTEWEWQWAAQGGAEAREYPWGEEWREGYANTAEAGLNRAVGVGMYPQGAAKCGALDMSGNLWEWCLNKYGKPSEVVVDGSGDSRVLRGGSDGSNQANASCVYRNLFNPYNDFLNYGFRVVVCAPMRHSEL